MKIELPQFDVLLDMARNDPQRLEQLRRDLTRKVIDGARSDTQRKRLEGLQFQVDLELQRAGTPLAGAIRISEMMTRSLADLHRSLVTPFAEAPAMAPPPTATVLPFNVPVRESAPQD